MTLAEWLRAKLKEAEEYGFPTTGSVLAPELAALVEAVDTARGLARTETQDQFDDALWAVWDARDNLRAASRREGWKDEA